MCAFLCCAEDNTMYLKKSQGTEKNKLSNCRKIEEKKNGFDLVAMNPKAENSCAVRRVPSAKRRAKLSKQTAPRKSEKKFSKAEKFYRRWKAFLSSRKGGK